MITPQSAVRDRPTRDKLEWTDAFGSHMFQFCQWKYLKLIRLRVEEMFTKNTKYFSFKLRVKVALNVWVTSRLRGKVDIVTTNLWVFSFSIPRDRFHEILNNMPTTFPWLKFGYEIYFLFVRCGKWSYTHVNFNCSNPTWKQHIDVYAAALIFCNNPDQVSVRTKFNLTRWFSTYVQSILFFKIVSRNLSIAH